MWARFSSLNITMRYYEIVAEEAATQSGVIKPRKPLTPVQQQVRQKRNAATQKRISDEQAAAARKVADLRAGLS